MQYWWLIHAPQCPGLGLVFPPNLESKNTPKACKYTLVCTYSMYIYIYTVYREKRNIEICIFCILNLKIEKNRQNKICKRNLITCTLKFISRRLQLYTVTRTWKNLERRNFERVKEIRNHKVANVQHNFTKIIYIYLLRIFIHFVWVTYDNFSVHVLPSKDYLNDKWTFYVDSILVNIAKYYCILTNEVWKRAKQN